MLINVEHRDIWKGLVLSRRTAVSIESISAVIASIASALVFVKAVAVAICQMPTPRMRNHRHPRALQIQTPSLRLD